MAQSTILAAGTTVATSTDVMLVTGVSATVGLFTSAADGVIPSFYEIWLLQATPGKDRKLIDLSKVPPQIITGPGTFRVSRPSVVASNVAIGVFLET